MGELGNNNIKLEMHIEEVEQYTNRSIRAALEAIGLKAESYAKLKCPVDTGLLRNSIAHAVGGTKVGIGAEKETLYKSSNPDDKGHMHLGVYTGNAPRNKKDEFTVYIGTNVEYAPYVEMGHINAKSGRHVPAQPFIRPALLDHIQEWEQDFITIAREEMKEELEHKRGKFTDDDN